MIKSFTNELTENSVNKDLEKDDLTCDAISFQYLFRNPLRSLIERMNKEIFIFYTHCILNLKYFL